MSFWTAMVVIVALVMFTAVHIEKVRARHGYSPRRGFPPHHGHKLAEPQDPALKREVEELRERVKVLERIATEDRETKLLSSEIERLRDK